MKLTAAVLALLACVAVAAGEQLQGGASLTQDFSSGDEGGNEREVAAKDKTGGSTTVLANKNYMSIMEDAEGRELSPHLAAAEGRLEAHEAARKREAEGTRKRAQESNAKRARHKKAMSEAEKAEKEAQVAKQRTIDEVRQAQAKTAELNARTAALRKKVVEEREKRRELQWTFAKGYSNYGSGYQEVRVTPGGGACELEGLARAPNSRSARIIGYLPKQCRPTTGKLAFQVKTGPHMSGRGAAFVTRYHRSTDAVWVDPEDGAVHLWPASSRRTVRWVSLSGIRIPVEGGQSGDITIGDGWQADPRGFRGPQLKREHLKGGRLCTVSGRVSRQGATRGSYVASVRSSSCFPDYNLVFTIPTRSGDSQLLRLNTKGELSYGGNTRRTSVSFDGLVYPGKGSAAVKLPLTSSWRHYDKDNHGPARFHRIGNVCLLSGRIQRTRGSLGSSASIARLPAGCRPQKRLIFLANNVRASVRIDVQSNGVITYTGGMDGYKWISLSNVHFVARQ